MLAQKKKGDSADSNRDAREKEIVKSFSFYVQAIELYNCLRLRDVWPLLQSLGV